VGEGGMTTWINQNNQSDVYQVINKDAYAEYGYMDIGYVDFYILVEDQVTEWQSL
jgi:hypothetical protein